MIGVFALAALVATGSAAATEPRFPPPARPVAPVVSPRWSTEEAREHVGEAEAVIAAIGDLAGKTIADIGAGEGYYEPHLARVATQVVAEDINPATVAQLKRRFATTSNIRVLLGRPDDATLTRDSTDVALMVHMYHEITQPYALLWRLRTSLRAGGRVAIVDADRPTSEHGTPRKLLECELSAVGYRQVSSRVIEDGVYLGVFAVAVAPKTIVACR